MIETAIDCYEKYGDPLSISKPQCQIVTPNIGNHMASPIRSRLIV
jgi:hypothetical protein